MGAHSVRRGLWCEMTDGGPSPTTQLTQLVEATTSEIRDLYLADGRPWVIGYSGGKDSTTALQLIWNALAGLDEAARTKSIYVIAGDTLVETPVIIDYLGE